MQERPMVAWGEVLWDVFPDELRLGGAPSNVAVHMAALGASAALISRVGKDSLGERALAELASRGVEVGGVDLDPELPTGMVNVVVHQGEPTYTMRPGAWQRLRSSEPAIAILRSAKLLCFGTLAQEEPNVEAELLMALRHLPEDALVVFDVNLRSGGGDVDLARRLLRHAHVVKANEREVAQIEARTGRSLASELFAHPRAMVLAQTRGAEGALLSVRGRPSHTVAPTLALPGGDNVGAGDAFTACLAMGCARGAPFEQIGAAASRYAAFVASQPGATPRPPAPLVREVSALLAPT